MPWEKGITPVISALMPTYARARLAFERGEGVWLYTADGERYLDFGGGIAVSSVGHSHPHLVHEMIDALVTDRDPFPNARQSANWTCVGLCAHESAMAGGKIVKLPAFSI